MKLRLALFAATLLALAGGAAADTYTGRDFINDLVKPGERQGLILRLDLGGGLSHVSAEHSTWSPSKFTFDGFAGGQTLGLGYGVTDQVILCGSWTGLFYGQYGALGVVSAPVAGIVGGDAHEAVMGSISYYGRRTAPSWFIEIGAGIGWIGNPFEEDVLKGECGSGPSLCAGVGYEVIDHHQVAIRLLWSQNSKDDQDKNGKWTAISLFLVYSGIAY